jgi:Spy/CpxP family protein refolding chaperone
MKFHLSKLAMLMGAVTCGTCLGSPSYAQDANLYWEQSPTEELQEMAFLPTDEIMISAPVIPGGPIAVAADEDSAAAGHGPGHWHERKPSICSTLTDDQLEKMHSLHNQFLDDLGPKLTQLSSLSRKLKDVLMANTIDTSQAKALQKDINGIKADIGDLKLEHKIAALNVLTSDQKKELRDRFYRGPFERIEHHHHHMGGGEMHHHPGME